MIPFNKPAFLGPEIDYINKAVSNNKISGNGEFSKKCTSFFETTFHAPKAMLTTSCTHALEIAALLSEIKPGDEVIMPSYTFTSTANSFILRGAKAVFIDIREDTMNMDEQLVERAITPKTKAIVPVHYAGVACEMDLINEIALKHKLFVVEDAAQGVMCKYKGKYLGTLSDFGCYSFHETKNYTCGEGGAIIIRDPEHVERAEIIWEKGTNRNKFFRGEVDKYTWVDIGSSYLPSEINAAFLWAQLEKAEEINNDRLNTWNTYYNALKPLEDRGVIGLPFIPKHCEHNAHMFYIKTANLTQRTKLIEYLKDSGIMAIFHYIPLHSSPAGKKFGYFSGEDVFTTKASEKIIRLPMFFGLKKEECLFITSKILDFYKKI
ncbi:MAG: dTDP-4-amino-4,6-dideoxygalactose transaminase [bacterium]